MLLQSKVPAVKDYVERREEEEPMQLDNVPEDDNQGRQEQQEPMQLRLSENQYGREMRRKKASNAKRRSKNHCKQENAPEDDKELGEEIAPMQLWDETENYPNVISANSSTPLR